jgi:hypothetical protein
MSVIKSPAGRLALACSSAFATMFVGSAFAAPCVLPAGAGPFQTACETAVQIPGNPLRSFDISWVDASRNLYFLGDRSNNGIDIVNTSTNQYVGRAAGFVGVVLTPAGAVNNNASGPDGVVSRGKWLYGGDGNSTLKVFDISNPAKPVMVASVPTGGTTRVDEMALDGAGTLLLAANNAEDPPFSTLFDVSDPTHPKIITKISASASIIPAGLGLSMEQPTWDNTTKRFLNSIPQIVTNPAGCDVAGAGGKPLCEGGLAVIDPTTLTKPTATLGAFDATTNTGIIGLHQCGPNGATVGPNDNVMLGCTPQNVPTNDTTLVINATTKYFVNVGNITGSDEVWYNAGDNRYYLGASRACGAAAGCPTGGAALGVVNAASNFFIEKLPVSSNSHSVAADSKNNRIYVPQVAPSSVVGSGGDTTTVGAGLCGTSNGCVVVFRHQVDNDDGDDDGGGHGGGHHHDD